MPTDSIKIKDINSPFCLWAGKISWLTDRLDFYPMLNTEGQRRIVDHLNCPAMFLLLSIVKLDTIIGIFNIY